MTRLNTFALFILLLLGGSAAFAQDNNYAYSLIPANLLKNANAVIRTSHTKVEIVSVNEMYITKRYAVTILNENGAHYGILRPLYNNFIKIENIEGHLYDATGTEIQKLKQKEITEENPPSEHIDDYHYKKFNFNYGKYPYTCEYEVTCKINCLLFLYPWYPQINYDCAVENAGISVEYPNDIPLRYRAYRLANAPAITTTGDNKHILTDSSGAIAATLKPDDFTSHEHHYPGIEFVADKFEMGDMQANTASWKDFGLFFYKLNEHRDDLPEETKKIVHNLTDTCHSAKSKIDVLYRYLQTNTRYVSIQLGIGGWQTLEASFVAEKGYGDCKALSNYMKALLKEAHITSYQALVYAGATDYEDMSPDFPHNQFNHAILCVPNNGDTVWVECTAKGLPAGYMSSFTCNRHALLLTPDGGFPLKTPIYGQNENTTHRAADIMVNDKDEMHGTLQLQYTGLLWDQEEGHVVNTTKSELDKHFNSHFRLGSYSVSNCKIENDLSGKIPVVKESLNINGDGNISKNAHYLFLKPGILPLAIQAPASYDKRTEPFLLHYSYQVDDTLTYHLTGNYTMGSPKAVHLDFPFASYSYQMAFANNTLTVITHFAQKEGEYAPEQFADYIKLYKQVNSDVGNKLVLERKD